MRRMAVVFFDKDGKNKFPKLKPGETVMGATDVRVDIVNAKKDGTPGRIAIDYGNVKEKNATVFQIARKPTWFHGSRGVLGMIADIMDEEPKAKREKVRS
jgi:hypothetical protein